MDRRGRADRDQADRIARDLARAETIAIWLDRRIGIPGTPFGIGIDALAGLIPGIGDGVTALASLSIVAIARRMGAPFGLLLRMLVNIAIDTVVGAIPLVGDLFDIAWQANMRNVRLLRAWTVHAAGQPPGLPPR